MARIGGFGEILLRLEVSDQKKFLQLEQFNVNVGGAELNTLISLSNFGHSTKMLSCLPDNQLGQKALNYCLSQNVDTSNIYIEGDKLGIYFIEKGFGARPSQVIYDRKNSSFSQLLIPIENIKKALEDIDVIHLTGISLAVSEISRTNVLNILKCAHEKGKIVSFDFNYRSKLVDIKTIKPVYQEVMSYVDILFAAQYDVNNFLDCNKIEEVLDKYDIKAIFHTKRNTISANRNELRGYGYFKDESYVSKNIEFEILDRIGAGDAFVAGILHYYLEKKQLKEIVDFGLAASILKHTVNGDANMVNVEQVENFVKYNGNMVVDR